MLSEHSNSQGSKPRPLSSQPKRNWGDEDETAPPPQMPFSFELGEEDWPPTPPKKKTPSAFTGSVSSNPAKTNASRPLPPSTSTARPQQPSSSLPPSNFPSKPPQPKMVPMFSQAKPKPAPVSAHPPRASTSSTSAYNASASSSSAATATKKRVLPWDNLLETHHQQPRASKPAPSAYHTLPVPGGSGSSQARTSNESLNIRQKVVLSSEQQMVLQMVVNDGRNVFFTGSAGTGKSVLLREIISALKVKFKGRSDAVAVTASTGMAACNIGGSTIHSFSGIGLGKESAEILIANVRKNRIASGKWARTQVLVVDEISMVDGILFDKLAAIAQALKKRPGVPFGGIQLVVTGDFFQLPPVAKGIATFAFEAKSWLNTIQHTVNLTQVFRQKSTEFIDMLNEMRFGQLSAASITRFKNLDCKRKYNDGVEPTELFPRREDVEKSNKLRLSELSGEPVVFQADDWPLPEHGRPKNTYLQNFMAPEELVLKVGAQVMLIKNLDTVLVNGTIGIVVGFGVPDFDDDEYEDSNNGRVKTEEETGYQAKKKIKLAGGAAPAPVELAPIIEWRTVHGMERRAATREDFKVEGPKGDKLASRRQYPIILAWAMSIHKSQGQTLPRVRVDLRKVFEKGQSYVALSRATCLEGLEVIGFDAKKVEAHPKVIAWSKKLTVLA